MVCQRYEYHKYAENNKIITLSLECVTRKVVLMNLQTKPSLRFAKDHSLNKTLFNYRGQRFVETRRDTKIVGLRGRMNFSLESWSAIGHRYP